MREPDQDPDTGVRITGPKHSSVGVEGIAESLRYTLAESGPVRGTKTLLAMNQVDGFDCPSCAWGDPAPGERKHAEFCENGAKAVAWEATRKRVDAEFFATHSVTDLRQRDGHWLEAQGRLTEPVYLPPGGAHFTPIGWDDAIALVAERLRGLPDPNRAVFYTSGRTSNEAAFLYQLLARRLGTNNLPDCSNMCHESSGAALSETIGVGKGVVTMEDITEHADLLMIVGQNPGTCHPRMLTALEQAKKRGARIIAVNPLPEAGFGRFHNPQTVRGLIGPGTQLADLYVPVRVNGDLAFFNALNRILLDREEEAGREKVFDHDFIDRYCDGFEEACDAWRTLDWAQLEDLSGLSTVVMEKCADEVMRADSVIVCWAMGLTQHRNAVPTIREIVNFLLLRGNIGRPGAGPSPIRGHSNVQGDRTVGIWEKMPDSFLDALREEFGFEPPREHGWDTVDSIRAMRDGKVDVFFAVGGNFAAATPDTEVTEAAIARCGLTVNVATKLNRTHLCHGAEALILPCLGRTERDFQAGGEQFVTVEDSLAMVHASRGRLLAGSPQLRSEIRILADLGQALFGDDLGWREMGDDYSVIRRHIEHVVPGFHAFEQRVGQPEGFMLPRAPHDTRTFPTETGKARFTVNPPSAAEVPPGHLLLTTVRSHDQFNTTVYGLDDRYRGVKGGRHVVFVNEKDVEAFHLAEGDLVDLVSVYADGERRAPGFRVVGYPIPRGCAAAYYPETNVLVPLDSTAETSNTPNSKSIVIRLEPAVVGAAK